MDILTQQLPASFDLECGGRVLHLSRKTHLMGVLNVTPDSFSDGGLYLDADCAVDRGIAMQEQGADILDVGGESTRPGSDPVPEQEEIRRVVPVIERLAARVAVPISIDTMKAAVAEAALAAGASMINDVSGMRHDRRMAEVAATSGVPVVLMHMRGMPKTMQDCTAYGNLIDEIGLFFNDAIARAVAVGVERRRILLDPGIGFGKSMEDNFRLIRNLDAFVRFGLPLVIGVSRKSFIGRLLGLPESDRAFGTAAAVAAAIFRGCHIVRVHDVKEMAQVATVADRIGRSI
ncbi:dihydropteroate synthase [bacterium]|nr:dihydropteroate synthase [bacterium]